MNRDEARGILLEELEGYRRRRHEELVGLVGTSVQVERRGQSGTEYQMEIDVFWDDPRRAGGDVRVLGSIDDGGLLAALAPVTESVLVGPGGVLVGE